MRDYLQHCKDLVKGKKSTSEEQMILCRERLQQLLKRDSKEHWYKMMEEITLAYENQAESETSDRLENL